MMRCLRCYTSYVHTHTKVEKSACANIINETLYMYAYSDYQYASGGGAKRAGAAGGGNIDIQNSQEFPPLSDAIKADVDETEIHRQNREIARDNMDIDRAGRDELEVSGARHGGHHSTVHPPDRVAFHREHQHEGDADESSIERTAREILNEHNLHGRAREHKKIVEPDFVDRDIKPKERELREQQSREAKKYVREHSEKPPPEAYAITEEEKREKLAEATRMEAILARQQIKHTLMRERKHEEQLGTKEMNEIDTDRSRMKMGVADELHPQHPSVVEREDTDVNLQQQQQR
jgi:hypothetical protein